MFSKRLFTLLSATGGLLVVSGTAAVALTGTVAQSAALPALTYDIQTIAAADAEPSVASVQPAAVAAGAEPVEHQIAAIDPAAVDCMAKVIHHEARNQPRKGQIAVARTLINRIKAGGRFGDTVCAVANQRGQFFDTAAYRPSRESDTWANAVDVSRAVLRGDDDAQDVAPGAVYFRAAYKPANSFFRGRQRVAEIGDHVFYR
jgi:spore germination cell wall hydrolase CwlJ-like protein